jgi:four helix bundle protein
MLYIAYGSVCEIETQVLLAGDLGFIDNKNMTPVIESIAEIEGNLKRLSKPWRKST